MALIGQGAQGVPIDYSAWSNSAWNLANANAGAVAQVGAKIEGMIEQRKKNKDTVKVSADKIDAAIKLFGDQGGYLTGIRESLKDEDVPLSQRAALGGQIDEMLNLGIDKMRNDALMDIQKRQVTVQEGEFEMRKRAADFDLGTAEEARAEQERITEFTARPILENVLRQTQEAEARGESPLIPSEKLKLAFLKSPKEQSQIAATAYQGLPKPQPVELREVGFTRDGQPMKGTAVFDQKSGTFNLVPVRDPSEVDVSGLPPGLAGLEKDFEEAGAKYGVDPKLLAAISIHETAGGTSNAFRTKNNAMGISDSKGPIAVASPRESIERMARLLGSTTSGPYKGAQTIDEIAKIYAPPGAGNDPRNLNPAWSGSVKRIMEELGGDPSAPIRIQPGATTARQPTPQTPEQQRKAELEVKKLEGEIASQESASKEKAQVASRAVQKVETLKEVAKKYIDEKTGTPTKALRDATGFGEGVGSFTRLNAPQTRANQQELEREFLEKDLLEAAKDLKPVSEDEMKMLLSRRPAITAAPEVWSSYIQSIIKTLESGLPGGSAPTAAAPTIEDDTQGLLKFQQNQNR